jgi:hypothetical protein
MNSVKILVGRAERNFMHFVHCMFIVASQEGLYSMELVSHGVHCMGFPLLHEKILLYVNFVVFI